MKEIFKMWKSTKMVVLVALSAGIYAAVLIPFKGFVLIPGITEFRPASALPVVLGLLFGPAGAWGAAIGNLIGDFFGSLGIGSTFGFIGNFMFAYVPYKIWTNFVVAKSEDKEPNVKGGKRIFGYIVASILGSAACALVIAWGLELLGMVPFAALGTIITLNNSIPSIVLGLPLILVLYPRIKKWDLLWTDIMDEEDLPKAGGKTKVGVAIMIIAILFGMIAGLGTALGVGQAAFNAGFGSKAGNSGVIITAGIGAIALIISMFLN
jgi:energy-coupling factor transport system substrate-specific component